MSDEKQWTNEEILREILGSIISTIYSNASDPKVRDWLREDLDDGNPERLRDRLVTLQIGPVLDMLSYFDGAIGPTKWPGVSMVNATTGEPLSPDFQMDFADVESDYV